MNGGLVKILFYIVAALTISVVAYFNYVNIIEAYGNGAPYYDRTTNMDKWQNPIPSLIVVNVVALGGLYALFRLLKKVGVKKPDDTPLR